MSAQEPAFGPGIMSAIRKRLRQQYRRARLSVREGSVVPSGAGTGLRFHAAGDPRRDEQPPTVLVHGYKDDATVFAPLARHLSEVGVRTYAVTLAPSDCSVPLEVLAQQLKTYISSNFAYNQQLNFVGFSLGGIVARYYLQRMGGLERTGRFLSVATPHRGTWVAFASRLPAALQLRPNSAFLRDLNADAERLASIRFSSMWTPLDLMIVPSFNSRFHVGANMAVWTLQHQGLITGRRGIGAIAKVLTSNDRESPGIGRSPLDSGLMMSR